MTTFFYGCDMSAAGLTAAPSSSLQSQRNRIIAYLKENNLPDFDKNNWYSDTGEAILQSWITRPGAIQLLIRCRKGDEILIDKPERIVSKSGGRAYNRGTSRVAIENIQKTGIAIHTTMKEFPDIVTHDTKAWEVMANRYRAMLSLAKFGSTCRPFNIPIPLRGQVGWRTFGNILRPDRSERILAINVYNCAINFILPVLWVCKAFRLNRKDVINCMIAAENQFSLSSRYNYTPYPIAARGPSVPNMRALLLALCGRPLSLREWSVATGLPALHLHYMVRNLLASKGLMHSGFRTPYPINKMLVPTVVEDKQYMQVAKVKLCDEAKLLISSDSPLVDYESVADSFSNMPSSGRIFLELDGVDPPSPDRFSSLDVPMTDFQPSQHRTSRPPDPEPDQPASGEPESPAP